MKKQKILIDTDMGNDDVMAISMLMLNSQIRITGISTVYGVSRMDIGAQNINNILNFCGYKTPVICGADKALSERQASFPIRDSSRAENLTLLNSLNISQKSLNLIKNQPVEDFIFKKILEGNTQILALGPLTNIAKTIHKYREKFCNNVDKLIIMGGGINKGNVAPLNLAEYNIWMDPEAAKIVFDTNINICMVGIDATRDVPIDTIFTEKIKNIFPKKRASKIIREIILNNDNDLDQFYDPLAAAILTSPSLIKNFVNGCIKVDLKGKKRGKTTFQKTSKRNLQIITGVYSENFYQFIINLIK